MKVIRIHKKVAKEIDSLDFSLKRQLSELFAQLASGENLGMPVSRPMPSVKHGVHELRLKDRSGQYRVFYYTKKVDAILVFHFFKKKTQETPLQEISTAQSRLEELL
ncbi:MAG: type II toxin-antitoxin system RelE/ParE family toxin [Bdellovibrionales bacterium]